MGWISGIAIYFIIWWVSLFVILPLGVRSQVEDDDVVLGTAHSAPSNARMGRKILQTTVLATAIFAVFYLVTQVYGFGPDDLPHIIPGT
ncbi:DUF1467 family protein [Aurantimonas marina]|uniref:DUF1467 family protein n=1 Tax=Aurantimonas marina TaxID=2780508 RepID=UPI0019D2DE71|nr:DUF1467 family protein [Aurantimonas marina]